MGAALCVLLGLVMFVGIGATFGMLKIVAGTLLIAYGIKKIFREYPTRKNYNQSENWRGY